jgi:putative ABC transport system permease protein
MVFVFRMAARELRAAWRRLLFFFVCVAIGVGAIALLRSVIQNVREGMTREARVLAAADVVVQTNRILEPEAQMRLERAIAAARPTGRAEVVELTTMARPEDRTKAVVRMVELEGVDHAFPLYGEVKLEGGQQYRHALLGSQGALVRPELLAQLGLRVGDRLLIGRQAFEIRGVVVSEPGRRLGMFSLGPRVIVDRADLPQTGLLGFGNRARHLVQLRVPEAAIDPLVQRVRNAFRREFVSARSFRNLEDRLGRRFTTAENYLSLIGLAIVVIGGIGVWSVTRVFVRQKLKNVAVLKCLGATTMRTLAVYLLQVALLAVGGSMLGLLLAGMAIRVVPQDLSPELAGVSLRLTRSAILQAGLIGFLVSMLFALVPLAEVRRVRPLWLLRDDAARLSLAPARARGWREWLARIDLVQVGAALALVVVLVAVTMWQADSLRVGGVVAAVFLGVVLVLDLAGTILVRATRPLAAARWFPLRHAVIGLRRPGNQTRVILLAVGLGTFFILTTQLIQASLLREFTLDLRPDAPDMFLIDVQRDQAQPLVDFLRERGVDGRSRLLPVLRARVTGLRGGRSSADGADQVNERGGPSREFVVTYRESLQPNERLVQGEFWPARRSGIPEVSVERGLQEEHGLRLGDRLRFDVLGRVIEARVASVREVDWSDARNGGFMFVFRPGLFDAAPHTFLGILRAPDAAQARAGFQRDLVDRFPNVSAIDVREVVRTLQSVLGRVTLAISVVGAVALIAGVLILVGSVVMTKFQRLYEAAILKTLGASSRTVGTMLALEHLALGALGGAVGAAGALVLSYVLCREVFEVRWTPEPLLVLTAIVIVSLGAGVVGVVASVDVLRRKPLAVLRAE